MTYSKQDFLKKARPLVTELMAFVQDANKFPNITDVRVVVSGGQNLQKKADDKSLVSSSFGTTHNVIVELYSGDKTIAFQQTGMSLKALKSAIQKNAEIIDLVPGNPNAALLEPEKVSTAEPDDLDLFDNSDVTGDDLTNYAMDMAKTALSDERIKTARSSQITRSSAHTLIVASNGQDVYLPKTSHNAYVSVASHPDSTGMMASGGEGSSARHFSDLDSPTEVGQGALEDAVSQLETITPQTATMPVVLNHAAAEAFFGIVFGALDGGAVHEGRTFFKDKLGQQVMNENITITDNPRVKRGLKSMDFDSAGIRAEPITFIENGILKQFNVNLHEARQLGIDPIGREDGRTNTYVSGGDKSPEDLIADIKEGIYVEGFLGGAVNVNDGTHSRQAVGRRIKDGKITSQAVSGFVVAGNLKDMFMGATVANDVPLDQPTKYDLFAPTTRIDGLKIAGA